MDRPSAWRRYRTRLGLSMALYVVSLVGALYLVRHDLVHGAVLWPLALLPAAGVLGAFYAIGMLIVETADEFIRMLIVRQVLYATAIAMSLAAVWGFLEMFGLVPHALAFYWAVAWFFGFGIGGLVNRFTLGSSGSC